jgi:hypothetical protein
LRQNIPKHAVEGKLTAHWHAQHPDLISGEHSAAALLEQIKKEKEESLFRKNELLYRKESLMFDRIIKRMREKIHIRQYVMTLHAEEEMDDDGLFIDDVERIILTGEIIERQKDYVTGEWKYLVKGQTIMYRQGIAVAKLSLTGKLFIITVPCRVRAGEKICYVITVAKRGRARVMSIVFTVKVRTSC